MQENVYLALENAVFHGGSPAVIGMNSRRPVTLRPTPFDLGGPDQSVRNRDCDHEQVVVLSVEFFAIHLYLLCA